MQRRREERMPKKDEMRRQMCRRGRGERGEEGKEESEGEEGC